jgi:hypothetical protein
MAFDLSKYKAKAADELKKVQPLLTKLGEKFGSSDDLRDDAKENIAKIAAKSKDLISSASSLSKVLMGAPGMMGEYYFPTELIGGTCPRVMGEEEDIIWNAAAEACDSERVHVVWQSVEGKIWYLAVRSSELASHQNTWCPFAAVLPGMKDAVPPPVCYTYYGDESATMMLLTAEGLQIYRGTNLVVRAKAERSAREMGDAPIIELVPDKIMELSAIPWYSLSLFEERARRILAAVAVFTALTLAGFSFVIWLFASMSLIASKHNLTSTLDQTEAKTMDLMRTVEKLRSSPMREQLATFADLNDNLLAVNGLLQVYEIKDGKPRWRAIIPTNVTGDRINEMGGKNIETNAQGVVIGNAAEIEYEALAAGRK